MYIDDGLCTVNGKEPACAAIKLVFQTLEQAGFAVHLVKSFPVPTQRLVWLRFVIDMTAGQIEVPQSKIVASRELLDCVKQTSHVKAKCSASVVGKIMSMSLALGPVSRFMTHSLYVVLESGQS